MESASALAVRQVVAWASDQGMSIRGRLSEAQLSELKRVFSKERAWSFDLYFPLQALAHALPRLDVTDAPARILFGDCLSALDELLPADVAGVWTPNHALSAVTASKLEYAETSAGISRMRSKHRPGWQQHAEHNRAFLLRGAARAEAGNAMLVGAGKLYDVPLKQLLERFERLVLVDVDGAAMAESVASVLGDSPARERLTEVTADVTGLNEPFVRAVDAVFERQLDADATADELTALLCSLRFAGAPTLFSGDAVSTRFSAAFSSMVVSQLAVPLTRYVEIGFGRRFPGAKQLDAPEMQVALAQFSQRVQHRHAQALLACAPALTFTSDVSERYTKLERDGSTLATQPRPLIGAPHLSELLPAAVAGNAVTADWEWARVLPTARGEQGRLLSVHGCSVQT